MSLSVKDGEISESTIIDVKIGKKGLPGELVGNFTKTVEYWEQSLKIQLMVSMEKRQEDFQSALQNSVPVAYQYNIKPGKATILTTIDDKGIQEYDIMIFA